jgi:hypothetical protein
VQVDEPGNYKLRVCKTNGTVTCCDSAEVVVLESVDAPDAPAAIAGPTAICQGQTATYTATTVPEATSYVWTVPAGVVITSGQNTQSITVTWNSANGGNVCVSSSNNCGTSTPTCVAITVTPTAIPTTPMGADSVCAGTSSTYSIAPVTGATAYNWTVTGGTITSGQGTTAVVVDWGTSNGSVCVNATGACGNSADFCLPVTVTSIPAAAVITGVAIACPNDTLAYSVAAIPGATLYQWQITNGSILSGQGSTSTQVVWNSNAATETICVNAGNGCGTSMDTCLTVGLSIPVAGQITTVCDPTNTTYTVSFAVSGGTVYLLLIQLPVAARTISLF